MNFRRTKKSEEYESFIKKNENKQSHPYIPSKAKKSIIFSIILIFLGLLTTYLFIATFFSNTFMSTTEGRWAYFIYSILTIPVGIRTLYIAYKVYNRDPKFDWPMIF